MKGGLLFADGPVNKTVDKPLPRGALSYLLNDRTGLRGGFGLFSYDYFFENINQAGFSQATPVLVTHDNGLTFTGRDAVEPDSERPADAAGRQRARPAQPARPEPRHAATSPDREAPYYTRWEVSLQRDLGAGWVAAFTYIGSRGSEPAGARATNNIPMQYLSTSRMPRHANESFLTQNVAEPVRRACCRAARSTARRCSASSCCGRIPEFGTFAIEEYTGSDRYDAGTLQIEKRFSSGNSLTAQYTRSRCATS